MRNMLLILLTYPCLHAELNVVGESSKALSCHSDGRALLDVEGLIQRHRGELLQVHGDEE